MQSREEAFSGEIFTLPSCLKEVPKEEISPVTATLISTGAIHDYEQVLRLKPGTTPDEIVKLIQTAQNKPLDEEKDQKDYNLPGGNRISHTGIFLIDEVGIPEGQGLNQPSEIDQVLLNPETGKLRVVCEIVGAEIHTDEDGNQTLHLNLHPPPLQTSPARFYEKDTSLPETTDPVGPLGKRGYVVSFSRQTTSNDYRFEEFLREQPLRENVPLIPPPEYLRPPITLPQTKSIPVNRMHQELNGRIII